MRAAPFKREYVKRSPFYEREKELGGYFMELGGWERAHGYAANEHLLKKYGNRVPVRENEWDNRHFWRVSNAEHLAMSEDCGIVNLSPGGDCGADERPERVCTGAVPLRVGASTRRYSVMYASHTR